MQFSDYKPMQGGPGTGRQGRVGNNHHDSGYVGDLAAAADDSQNEHLAVSIEDDPAFLQMNGRTS